MTGRRLVLVSAFTALAFSILCALGYWQVQRLAWKEQLIAAAETRATAPAVPLPPAAEWPSLDPEDYEYRSVSATGHFRHDREVHAYTTLSEPRGSSGGQGYWVLTPLDLQDGSGSVVVNRGFVPDERKDPATRQEGLVEGEVTVEGLMRAPQTGSWMLPDDDPQRNVWFTRDPEKIAAVEGLDGPVAPFTIDQVGPAPPGGLPQPGETRLQFENSHLGYAITWFGLAAALVAVYVALLRGHLRRN
ncbi:SURF1 family protein [Lutibaculum baratangense]|uniref:SURF1-like protein n=1 Tax=Lutibaculum baratangense AMV1 TaxID=631454 RepID=V4TFM4_9HYPH|nr:SURF1 family protein [Lutibaculum baratangense]ESR24933.1 Cytochrome oxidase biogenesis protein Surf1, facilitates heme A insertion [Lutibaculum baratangense AMV1]